MKNKNQKKEGLERVFGPKVFNEKALVGLTLEAAHKNITDAGLDSNLEKNSETGKVQISDIARIMILLPNYITVSSDKSGIVTKAIRG